MGVADFLYGRGDDGSVVFGVTEFEVHAAANVLQLEHGASPGGTGDGDLHGTGAELGMTGDEGVAAPEKNGGVAVVEGLDFKDRGGWQIVKKNSDRKSVV